MGIGARLKEERERLGVNQETLGAAGGVRKQAQLRYEQGDRSPDAAYLAGVASRGVDVLYVITGQHAGGVKPAPTLTAEEETLLAYFRAAPPAVRRAAMGALVGGALPGGMTMTQSGGGVQVGHSSGPVTVGAPAPRKRKTG